MDSSSLISTISDTINNLFNKIFSSVDNNLYSILDELAFIDTDILNDSIFSKILGTSPSSGILLISNSLILGYLIYYSIKLLFANFGITEVEKPAVFIFKLLICSIFMNFSIFICNEIIYIISLLSISLQEVGKYFLNKSICFSSLISQLNTIISIDSNTLDIFSLDGIIKSIVSISMLNLVITYSIRYILIKLFVLISPFCFLSLCNKNSSVLFKAWLKSFVSLLLIQVFVSSVLLLIFSLKVTSNNLLSKFLLVGSLFVLIKANDYIKEMLGGISTNINAGFTNFKSNILK